MDIICIFGSHWYSLWQRSQQIISRLARNNRVLYVEHPRDFFSTFRDFRRKRINLLQISKYKKITNDIFLHSPVVPISFRKYPSFNKLNLFYINLKIKSLIKELNFKNVILFCYTPFCQYFISRFNEILSCYDCYDEFSDVPKKLSRIIIDEENKLLSKANLVFVVSQELFQSKKRYNKNIYLIPNGVDYEYFNLETNFLPDDISQIKKPIIGFIGSIHDWIDLELIKFIANSYKNFSIVMIGPIHLDISALKETKNVYFLGEKKYEEIPLYLKTFDVCILPFKERKLINSADCIKTYEYLSVGKPIVSTNFPQAKIFTDVIRVANNKENFVKQIEEALKEKDNNLVFKRKKIAKENSWEKRVEQISKIISDHIKKK